MDQETRLRLQHKGQKAHIFDLGTKMAQMNGTGIPGPCADCLVWHRQTRGPLLWCSGILPHIIHILAKLNKQPVPHAESHISPLYIIAIVNFACRPPLVSTMENYSILKEERKQSLNSSMVCCIHKAWMSIANITLWFTAFCNIAHSSFFFLRKPYCDSVTNLNNA